jgi:hypothetical protein
MNFQQLQQFRQQAYQCLGLAKDATFELADAAMTTRHVSCLADLALNPLFRRQWSSIYEALQDCRPDPEQLMQLYIKQMSQVERPVLAIDHTAWLRPHAPTLKERTMNINPMPRLTAYLLVSVKDIVRLPGYLHLKKLGAAVAT